MESKAVYFEELGKINTDETLALAKRSAEKLGIDKILVASDSGYTAVKAMNVLKGFEVIIVTNCPDPKNPNAVHFTDENRKIVESLGGKILTCTPALGGINQALAGARHYGDPLKPGEVPSQIGNSFGDIVGTVLGFFGRGVKVAAEIAFMAADAELVSLDRDVMCIAGTHEGADTAVILRPVKTINYHNLRINQIICKPRL